MGARATRRGVSRWSRDFGLWHARGVDPAVADRANEEAAASVAGLKEQPPVVRIVHPVVPAPEHKCYRVIRLFLNEGHLSIEDIGHSPTAAGALAISTREEWRAQVLDLNGKVASDNWRSMERR